MEVLLQFEIEGELKKIKALAIKDKIFTHYNYQANKEYNQKLMIYLNKKVKEKCDKLEFRTCPKDLRGQFLLELTRNDPYFNALEIKHAYAVTCNKSQGDEWEEVFVSVPYIKMKTADYQWIYTAITRAKSKVYIYKNFY
jgi:hypothetical protein